MVSLIRLIGGLPRFDARRAAQTIILHALHASALLRVIIYSSSASQATQQS